MRCSDHEIAAWLREYRGSQLFQCRDGCGVYHALAPFLHHVGYFYSYSRYRDEITAVLDRCQDPIEQTRVLVAGFASEYSIFELSDIITSHGAATRLTAFDRCLTPVMRARQALDGQAAMELTACDILNPPVPLSQGGFHLIVADSFIKQFHGTDKQRVVSQLKCLLKPGGWLIAREYAGDLSILLHRFWDRLPLERMAALLRDQEFRDTWTSLQQQLQELFEFMQQAGETCKSPTTLHSILGRAGLDVVSHRIPDGCDYSITTARNP